MSDEAATPTEPTGDTALESAVNTLGVDLPETPDEAIEALATHVLEVRRTAESHLDDLKRVAADFENYRKRSERDRDGVIAAAARRVATNLLPVLDSLDAAAATAAETPGEERFRFGLLSTRDQLLDVLASEGVVPVAVAPGDPFDPNRHEAVSGGGDGHLVVTAVLRRGYLIGEHLLRPAMVEVAAEGLSDDEAGGETEE